MTYYIARSSKSGDYICINSDLYYKWFTSLNLVNPTDLPECDEEEDSTDTIEDWLENLKANRMTLILAFTEESHPEMFI